MKEPGLQGSLSDGLKVFVLRRYKEELDSDWFKGLDVVVAHSEEEAKELAAAVHPGTQKFGPYKSVVAIETDYAHYVCGRAAEVTVLQW